MRARAEVASVPISYNTPWVAIGGEHGFPDVGRDPGSLGHGLNGVQGEVIVAFAPIHSQAVNMSPLSPGTLQD